MKKIKVRMQNSYGQTRYYPKCETSQLFAKLLGQLSLTIEQMKVIKKLGYEAEVSQALQTDVKI